MNPSILTTIVVVMVAMMVAVMMVSHLVIKESFSPIKVIPTIRLVMCEACDFSFLFLV